MSNENVTDSDTEYGFDLGEMTAWRDKRLKVIRAIIVVVTVVVVLIVAGVALRHWRGGSGTNQAELYDSNIEAVSNSRADMSSVLNTSQSAIDLLQKYTTDSTSVESFASLRTQGQKLLDEAPSYYTTQPHTQSQYVTANNDLETYSNRLTNMTGQIREAMQTAGKGEVETGVNSAMSTLQSSTTTAQALVSDYNGQTESSQATVTGGYIASLNENISQAQSDLDAYDSSAAPYVLLQQRQTFENDNQTLIDSYNSMSAAYKSAKGKGGVSGKAQFAVNNSQVPSGLRGTWQVSGDDSVTVTFTSDSVQINDTVKNASSSSSSTPASAAKKIQAAYALAPGQRTDFGGSPMAAWTLKGYGIDPISDITVVLYQVGDGSDSSVFLGFYQTGHVWKLTTTADTSALVTSDSSEASSADATSSTDAAGTAGGTTSDTSTDSTDATGATGTSGN
ncbi:MAG: hypothetical protein PUF97_04730 [Bifidobacteriaceae bacterium]|nr:hypothetical protein [Bifidobacteriaceae bacterium]